MESILENHRAIPEARIVVQRYRCQRWVRACNARSSKVAGFAKHLREAARPTQIAYQRVMSAYGGEPVGVEIKNEALESWAFVVTNVYGDKPWRVQQFDQDGFVGHLCHISLESAVEDMLRLGYRTIDSGALDRITVTPRWHLGMRRSAIAQRHQEELSTFSQMLAEQNAIAT